MHLHPNAPIIFLSIMAGCMLLVLVLLASSRPKRTPYSEMVEAQRVAIELGVRPNSAAMGQFYSGWLIASDYVAKVRMHTLIYRYEATHCRCMQHPSYTDLGWCARVHPLVPDMTPPSELRMRQ